MAASPPPNPNAGLDEWLRNYLKRSGPPPNTTAPRPGATAPSSRQMQDLTNAILERNAKRPHTNSDKFMDGSHWWDDDTSAGSRLLDVLSRPLYGMANMVKYDTIDKPIWEGGWNPGEHIKAFNRGIAGKDKQTFSKTLHEQGLGNDGGVGAWGWGTLGFLADVGGDPTSWIPGKAFASGAQGAAKGLGKVGIGKGHLPRFGRAKNALEDGIVEPGPAPVDPNVPINPDGSPQTPFKPPAGPKPKPVDPRDPIVPINPDGSPITPVPFKPEDALLGQNRPKRFPSDDQLPSDVEQPSFSEFLKRGIPNKNLVPEAPVGNPKYGPNVGMVPTADVEHLATMGSVASKLMNFGERAKYTHPDDLKKIEEFREIIRRDGGFEDPITVKWSPEDGGRAVLGDGNHRIEAALQEGLEHIPTTMKIVGKADPSNIKLPPVGDVSKLVEGADAHPKDFFPNTQPPTPRRSHVDTQPTLPIPGISNVAKLLEQGVLPPEDVKQLLVHQNEVLNRVETKGPLHGKPERPVPTNDDLIKKNLNKIVIRSLVTRADNEVDELAETASQIRYNEDGPTVHSDKSNLTLKDKDIDPIINEAIEAGHLVRRDVPGVTGGSYFIPAAKFHEFLTTGLPNIVKDLLIKQNGRLVKVDNVFTDFVADTIAETKKSMEAENLNNLEAPLKEPVLKNFDNLEEVQQAVSDNSLTGKGMGDIHLANDLGGQSLKGLGRELETASQRMLRENEPLKGLKPKVKKSILDAGFAQKAVDLSPEQATIVANAVAHAGAEQFITPLMSRVRGKAFNSAAQVNMTKYIISRAQKLMTVRDAKTGKLTALSGAERSKAMYDSVVPMLRVAEQTYKDMGIPLRLGKGVDGLQISLHDALTTLPRPFVEKFVFGGPHGATLGVKQFADIVELYTTNIANLAKRSKLKREIVDLHAEIIDAQSKGLKIGKDIPLPEVARLEGLIKELDSINLNGIASLKKEVQKIISSPISRAAKGARSPLMNMIRNPNNSLTARKAVEEIDDFMFTGQDKLVALDEVNAAAHVEQVAQSATRLSSLTIEKVIAEIAETSPNSVLKVVDNLNRVMAETGKAAGKPMTAEVMSLAKEQVTANLHKMLPMESIETAIKKGKDMAKAKNSAEQAKAFGDASKGNVGHLEKLLGPEVYKTLNLGEKAVFGFMINQLRAIAPSLGDEQIRRIFASRVSVGQSDVMHTAAILGKIEKDFTREQIVNGTKAIQEGREIPEGINAHRAMWEGIRSLEGMIADNGLTLAQLLPKFEKFKLPNKFKLNPDDLANSWKKWEIEDPIDTFSKYHAVIRQAVAERELGAEFGRIYGSKTMDAEHTVRLVDKSTDPARRSLMHKLIDTDLFFSEDAARQVHMMDITLRELNAPPKFANSGVMHLFDAVLHSYKAGLTIYRPGHHVRNLMGDMWLASMDGVLDPKHYWNAAKVLGTRPEMYKTFDAMSMLKNPYSAVAGGIPDGQRVVKTFTFRGTKVHVTRQQMYRMMYDQGILPDREVLDDIIKLDRNNQSKINLGKYSPLKGKLHKGVSVASEYRDHWVRAAHFMKVLDEAKGGKIVGDSLDNALKDAARVAGDRVRKWHPDGSDLSHAEKEYYRRAFMFYSWTRKIIPLVMETALTRPGRFMTVPKANQAIAQANGIQQQDGLGDVFPRDQLMPSYLLDSTQGPMWGTPGAYAGTIPGWPHLDTVDDYFNSPHKTFTSVLGSTSFPFKQGIELTMDKNIRTNSPIRDLSDYWDNQLPGGNYAAAITGKSPTSLFRDDVDEVEANQEYQGNPNLPQGSPQLTKLLNFLGGQGLMDYSRPSYIKRAQIEEGQGNGRQP